MNQNRTETLSVQMCTFVFYSLKEAILLLFSVCIGAGIKHFGQVAQ